MASKIPRAFIDDLIARVDLVDLIDARVPLKKAGANYQARCPFHNEKSPSFNVNREKQFYHCFGCGASGNAISFLMDYERQSFIEAVETLADSLGLRIPKEAAGHERRDEEDSIQPLYQAQQQAAEFYSRQLREHPEAGRARDYLARRGLDAETIRHFQLGYAPSAWRSLPETIPQQTLVAAGLAIAKEGGGFYDRFRDRIMFPIRDRRGRVIGFGGRVMGDEKPKYLNSPETPTFKKHREVYGLYEWLGRRQKTERIVVVEGYLDVISLAQHGIYHSVATLGTATSADHANLLFRYAHELVFCFDGDNAGRAAAWKALEASLPALRESRSLRFLMLPEGQDPDTLVRQEGREGFERLLEQAQPLSDYLFQHLAENLDLTAIEGRSALFNQASALLGKLPAGVFKDMMLAKLGKLTGQVPASSKPLPFQGSKRPFRPPVAERAKPSNLRMITAMLIQSPSLFALLDAEARVELERDEKAGPLTRKLFAILDEKPDLPSGGLVERFRGEEQYKLVNLLNVMEIPLTEADRQSEFLHALAKFVAQAKTRPREQRLAWLNHKVSLEGFGRLNEQEREEYRQLLGKPNV